MNLIQHCLSVGVRVGGQSLEEATIKYYICSLSLALDQLLQFHLYQKTQRMILTYCQM